MKVEEKVEVESPVGEVKKEEEKAKPENKVYDLIEGLEAMVDDVVEEAAGKKIADESKLGLLSKGITYFSLIFGLIYVNLYILPLDDDNALCIYPGK